MFNDLGSFKEADRWTKSAVFCYSIGCKCSKCDLKTEYASLEECHMKASVLELVKKFGKPEKKEDKRGN